MGVNATSAANAEAASVDSAHVTHAQSSSSGALRYARPMRRCTWVVLAAVLSRALDATAAEPELIVVGPSPMVVMPPPVKRPLNWEPFILTAAGAAVIGIGVWRLFAAEADYQTLRSLSATPSTMLSNEQVLAQARGLVQSGKLNTGLGWTLLGLGVAAVGGSLAWLFTEGLEKDPVLSLAPLPGGAAAVVEGRF